MPEKHTLDQLHGDQTYMWLTLRQRKLVDAFLTNGGDKLKAVRAGYPHASQKSARVMVYSLFSNPHIVACLALANGIDPERAKFDRELERAIRNPKTTPSQIAALRLLAQTRGWVIPMLKSEAPASQASKPPAGQVKGARVVEGQYEF